MAFFNVLAFWLVTTLAHNFLGFSIRKSCSVVTHIKFPSVSGFPALLVVTYNSQNQLIL